MRNFFEFLPEFMETTFVKWVAAPVILLLLAGEVVFIIAVLFFKY